MAIEPTFSYPYSQLFVGQEKTVAISGPHIHVLNSSTGETLHSTLQFTSERIEQDKILKSGPIRCAVVDGSFKYLAEVGEDKMLKLWEIEGLTLVNSRELPKKPTSILFTKDSQTMLVSDKFGDVFSYPLVYTPFTASELEEQKEAKEKDPYASHTNPSNGQLVLGHVSPLNAMILSSDEKFIITSDRDEHIRVSWYPQGYLIEMYCMGHLKFVSALHTPPTDPSTLISGGGDPALKVWNWMTGKEKGQIPVAEAIEPFIAIKRVLGKNRWAAEDEGGENEGEGGGKGKKSKKNKAKGKGQQGKLKDDANAMEVDESGEVKPAQPPTQDTSVSQPVPQKILAIRRIETLTIQNAATFILFSAIGSTALFATPYKHSEASPDVRHIDFGRPVIDFFVDPSTSSSSQPLVWVLLDSSWSADDERAPTNPSDRARLVTVVQVDGEGLLQGSLLQNLNGPATVVPTSAKDLKSLDLYSELLSLPKYVEKLAPGETPQNVETGSGASTQAADPNLTKRKLGRMKRTVKVAEVREKVLSGQAGGSQAGDLPEETLEEEPETKRARSSSQTAEDRDP